MLICNIKKTNEKNLNRDSVFLYKIKGIRTVQIPSTVQVPFEQVLVPL